MTLSRLFLTVVLALAVAACAPSADIRIPNADGSIRPGRVVIVPVRADGDAVEVWDDLYGSADFSGASEHDDAFWSSLATALQAELGWDDVRLRDAVSGTDFVEVRALIQGAGGYDTGRWSVKTVSVPSAVDYETLDADHVLYVRRPTIESDTRTTGGPLGAGLKRVLVAEADVVWMDARQESPRLVQSVAGVGDQRGALLNKQLNRDSWNQAVEEMAGAVAREVKGPQ